MNSLPVPQPYDEPQPLPPRKPTSSGKSRTRPHRLPRWPFVLGGAVLLALGILAILLVRNWPYSESVLIPAIQDSFRAEVKIKSFRRFYFPHPGCAAEYVTLTRPGQPSPTAFLVTVQKIVIVGRYLDFLFRPHHFGNIKLDGLYVRIPSHHEGQPFKPSSGGTQNITVGAITTNGAVLEFPRPHHTDPFKFEIHYLRVESIAAGSPMSYQLTMAIPEPPAELQSQGSFGPWKKPIGEIPLHGMVKLTDAKLDKFEGIGGSFRSEERFAGTLEKIEVRGTADSPDFRLTKAEHPVAVSTEFQLSVNNRSGEVLMTEIVAKMGNTTARGYGKVAKNPETGRRETIVDCDIEHGRTEDLLWIFNEEPKPAMLGPAHFSGRFRASAFGANFLENLEATGHFEVTDGRFQERMQQKTNELSARARGKKVKNSVDAPDVTVELLSSTYSMDHGVAHFPDLDFHVPGAEARMHGTYNFLNHTVDLHGDLRTDASVSQASSGIKAVLLKPLDPLFHKKNAGAQVPVLMQGPIHHPHFGTDILHK